MKTVFTVRNIRVYIKINNLKACIWSILLHGCECWTLTKDLERRLETAEMWYIRIPWTEKKSNKEVMEMVGYKRSQLKLARKRQLWRRGLLVDTWLRDQKVPGSSPGCARLTLSPWERLFTCISSSHSCVKTDCTRL